MRTIGVRELRQHASRYLALVEAGEELAVTSHGRLVARLVPIDSGERSREALIEAGVIVPARDPGAITTSTPVRSDQTRTLTAHLDDIRGDR